MHRQCETKINLGNKIRSFVIQRATDDTNTEKVIFPEAAFLIALISGGDKKAFSFALCRYFVALI
jgi:hypothetical protein